MARISKTRCESLKPLAIILVELLLVEARVSPELDKNGNLWLRFKGDRDNLLNRLLNYIRSSTSLKAMNPELGVTDQWVNAFLQKTQDQQRTDLNDVLRCLYEKPFCEDKREEKDNRTYRHFVLNLKYSPLANDRHLDNLKWLFSPQFGQWDTLPSETQKGKLSTTWADLLPKNLCGYTPQFLQERSRQFIELEQLLNQPSKLSFEEHFSVLDHLIRFYMAQSDFQKASLYLQKLDSLLKSKRSFSKINAFNAIYYRHRAIYAYHHKNSEQAYLDLNTALKLQIQLVDRENETQTDPEWQRSLKTNLADVYHDLGCVEREMGKFDRSEEHLHQAIRLWDSLANEPERLASSLIQLGHLRSEQGRFAEAERIYKAVELRFGVILIQHPLLAHLYTGFGHLYAKQGSYEKAKNYYEKAIELSVCLYGSDSPQASIPSAGLKCVKIRLEKQSIS